MRNTSERVLGGGSRAQGALRTIYYTLDKMSKIAFLKWKKYVNLIKNKVLLSGLHSQKLLNNLQKLAIRGLRPALNLITSNKGDLLTELKGQKLYILLNRVPRRILRSTFNRIIGDIGTVKRLLTNLFYIAKNRTRNPWNAWKKYVNDVRDKVLLDNVKSQKLKNALNKVPSRTLKDAYTRIIENGDKIKGAINEQFLICLEDPFQQSKNGQITQLKLITKTYAQYKVRKTQKCNERYS